MAKAPDGLNILDALYKRIADLEQTVLDHENRFNTLTVNISQETVNALAREILHAHGTLLVAATTQQPVEETKEVAEEGTPI